MYLFCISCKQIVATIKVPTLVRLKGNLLDLEIEGKDVQCQSVRPHFTLVQIYPVYRHINSLPNSQRISSQKSSSSSHNLFFLKLLSKLLKAS